MAFQVELVVKNSSASAGDVRDAGSSLVLEDPLEKEMATHSSTLAWKIPSMEEPCGPQSMDGFGPISTYFSYFLVGSLVTFNIHKHVFLK